MKAGSVDTELPNRLGRFLRWFFNASPEVAVEPVRPQLSARRGPAVSQRHPPRVLGRHCGPVRVAAKGKP